MTFRVACLGAGYFAQFHHDGWQRNPSAKLVSVCDLDLAKAQSAGAAGYTDLQEMLNKVRPDILDIATPPATHADAIVAGLKSGVKAIVCQKPFCEDLVQAKEMAKLAAAVQVPLIVHENFRFQPWYRLMKERMLAGDIGCVLQVTFRFRPGDGQGARAYLDRQPYFQKMPRLLVHETAVHWIDTFAYLLGTPRAVYADLRRMNPVIAGEDAGYLMMDFDGGVRAMFDGNRLLDHAADNCRMTLGEAMVEGTKGTMTLRGDGSVTLRRFGETDEQVILATKAYSGFAGDCVYALQAHVTDSLAGHVAFENLAQEYLQVREIEEAAYRSSEEGRKITL